jgi:TolB-like protein
MDDRKRVAGAIRDYIARERMQFAFKTKLGKSTVDKLLVGLFSDKTLAIVEGQTGLRLRPAPPPAAAPEDRPVGSAAPGDGTSATAPRTALGLPDAPSIAVLPFTNMGGAPEQEHFADGIVEGITTALSRLRWLFVIARNSAFTYKGRAVDIRQVGRELGVRYVLEGSVRTGAGRIRVTDQLVDAETGKHIWAERYDRELRDIFAVQDEITGNVVASIAGGGRHGHGRMRGATRGETAGASPLRARVGRNHRLAPPSISASASTGSLDRCGA